MSQGWVHFFSSEEEILETTIAGTDGGTAGYGVYGGADYSELQSIQEMTDAAFTWAEDRGTMVYQAQGTPSDGWTQTWTEEFEEDDIFRAELVGEYQGEDGQIFNLQYTYEKGSAPADQYQLVDGYYEYYTTQDGVQAAIQMETSHTGKSMFWVTVYAGEIDFSMTGTQVELEELHTILDSLELSQLTGG